LDHSDRNSNIRSCQTSIGAALSSIYIGAHAKLSELRSKPLDGCGDGSWLGRWWSKDSEHYTSRGHTAASGCGVDALVGRWYRLSRLSFLVLSSNSQDMGEATFVNVYSGSHWLLSRLTQRHCAGTFLIYLRSWCIIKRGCEDQTNYLPHRHCTYITRKVQGAVQTPGAEGERTDRHYSICQAGAYGALHPVRVMHRC
jgi:hypothetical protein